MLAYLYQELLGKNALKGHLTDFSIAQLDAFIGERPESVLSGMPLSMDRKAAGGRLLQGAGGRPRAVPVGTAGAARGRGGDRGCDAEDGSVASGAVPALAAAQVSGWAGEQ